MLKNERDLKDERDNKNDDKAKLTRLIADNIDKTEMVEKLLHAKAYLDEKTELLIKKNGKLTNEIEMTKESNDMLRDELERMEKLKNAQFKAYSFREQ